MIAGPGPASGAPVVLLAGEAWSTSVVYNHLRGQFHIHQVVIEAPASRAALVRNRMRRLGASAVAGQLAFQVGLTPLLHLEARARRRELEELHGLDGTPPPEALVTRVASANSADSIELLRGLAPATVVINGTRILSGEVLASVDAPFVNVHAGMTPRYRGVHGGYWALAERRPEWCGVTIHLVDAGVDTGPVLAQAHVTPSPRDNFSTYPVLQLAAGLPLLQQAVADLLAGRRATVEPEAKPSKLWYHPTLAQYLRARLVHKVK